MTNHVQGEQLHLYLDGELSRAEAAMVESHLLACKACSCDYEELYKTVSALKALPRKAAMAGLEDRIDALTGGLTAGDTRATFTLVKRRPVLWRMRALAGAAVVLLICMVVVQIANKQKANKAGPAKVLNVENENGADSHEVSLPPADRGQSNTNGAMSLDVVRNDETKAVVMGGVSAPDGAYDTLVLYVDSGDMAGVREQLQQQLMTLDRSRRQIADGLEKRAEDPQRKEARSMQEPVDAKRDINGMDGAVLAELSAELSAVRGVRAIEVAWAWDENASLSDTINDADHADSTKAKAPSVTADAMQQHMENEEANLEKKENDLPLERVIEQDKQAEGKNKIVDEADDGENARAGMAAQAGNMADAPAQDKEPATVEGDEPPADNNAKEESSGKPAQELPAHTPRSPEREVAGKDQERAKDAVDGFLRRDGDDWLVFFKDRWVRVKIVESPVKK